MFHPVITDSIKPEKSKQAREQRKRAEFPICNDESKLKDYVVSLAHDAPFEQVDIPTGQKSVSFRKYWMHPDNSIVGTRDKKQTIIVWQFSEEQVEWLKKRACEYIKAGVSAGEWISIVPRETFNPISFSIRQDQSTRPETAKAADVIIKEQVKRAEAEKEKKK